MRKVIALIVTTLLLLTLFVPPVTAIISPDNPYNYIWFDNSLTYDEKVKLFKEVTGYNDALLIDQLPVKDTKDYYALAEEMMNGEHGLWEDLSPEQQLILSNYYYTGHCYPTSEQTTFRDESYALYLAYLVSADDISHDVQYGFDDITTSTPEERSLYVQKVEITLPEMV